MKKKPLTPRDIAVLAVVVAVFVGVIALFVVLASDGTNPAYHKCGDRSEERRVGKECRL